MTTSFKRNFCTTREFMQIEKSKIDKLLKICLKRLIYERSTYQGFRSIEHFLSKPNSRDMLSRWMPLPVTSLPLQWWYEVYVKYALMVIGKKVNGGWLVDFQLSWNFWVHLPNTLFLCVVWPVFRKWLHHISGEQTRDTVVPIVYGRTLEVVWCSAKKTEKCKCMYM